MKRTLAITTAAFALICLTFTNIASAQTHGYSQSWSSEEAWSSSSNWSSCPGGFQQNSSNSYNKNTNASGNYYSPYSTGGYSQSTQQGGFSNSGTAYYNQPGGYHSQGYNNSGQYYQAQNNGYVTNAYGGQVFGNNVYAGQSNNSNWNQGYGPGGSYGGVNNIIKPISGGSRWGYGW